MTTGGTPAAIVEKLNTSINEVLREPEFSKRFTSIGYEMLGGTVESFAQFIKEDIARYQKLTQAAGIVAE
jgi:tripartite-type tricarboxylate transporter receptor subunit TctC